MDEQPTDKVYMWLVLLTTIAWGAAITFGILAISEYKEGGYQVEDANPFE